MAGFLPPNLPGLAGGLAGGAVANAIGGPLGGIAGTAVSNVVSTIAGRAASYVTPFANWTPALFIPYRRSIGGIFAQITIDEQHTDEVQITDHPVEAGAPISDHAFARPQQVAITAGWSKATAFDLSAESGVYGLLLSLQTSFQPFDIYTGKRHYKNMLIERLAVTTDQHNEFSLVANIVCRQVIIVNTTSTTVSGKSDSNSEQTDPEKTATPAGKGETATKTPSSADVQNYEDASIKNYPDGPPPEKEINTTNVEQLGTFNTGNEAGQVIPIKPAPPMQASEFIEPPPGASPATISSP